MNGHQGTVRDVLEGVFHGMETGETAFHHLLRAGETVLCAVLPPPANMGLRKYGNNVNVRHRFKESFNSQTQNRLAVKQQELLGDVGSHANAGAACGND